MAANNKLPIFLILGGLAAAAIAFFATTKASATNTPKANPDPVNHPNAVLIAGIWRDSNYYFDPYSYTWKPLSSMPADITTGLTASFDRVYPVYRQNDDSKIIFNYLSIFVRVVSGYDNFQPGDKVKLLHKDYNGKTGSITQKFKGTDGDYFTISVPWNFVSTDILNIQFLSVKIPYNYSGGQLTKTY